MDDSDSKENVESLPYALALIRATLEATADGILAADAEGRITSWNTKFVEMWRMPLELIALRDGQKVRAFIALQLKSSERYLARIAEIEASKDKSGDRDERLIKRYFDVISVEERVVGRLWSFRDVTHRHELDLIPRRLAAIVDSSDDPGEITKAASGGWPAAGAADQPRDPPSAPVMSLNNVSVLFIDDELDARNLQNCYWNQPRRCYIWQHRQSREWSISSPNQWTC